MIRQALYYGSYGHDYPNDAYDPGYSNSYGDVMPDSAGGTPPAASPAGYSQSLYRPAIAATQADTIAHVTVRVPADANVWFENLPTTSTGPVREFNSPPLSPGASTLTMSAPPGTQLDDT